MNFSDLAIQRITPKLANGKNFKNLLRFTTGIFDKNSRDIELLKNLKDLNSESNIILDELGKLLTLYPRPTIKVGIVGSGFFQYDIAGYDQFPYAKLGTNLEIRELTNIEYSRLLAAASVLTTFNGTLDDYILLYTKISGFNAFIVNKKSSYDIIIQGNLSSFDKSLVEFLTNDIDNLTVKKNFLGTSDGGQVFQYGVSGYGISPYVQKW